MKYLVIILVVLVVAGVAGWFVLARINAASAAANVPQQTDVVMHRTIEKIVSANGKVASNRDVDIKCQASGTIKSLPYKDVSVEVKPGEMLCELDPVDMQRLVDTAKAAVDVDNSRITEANLNRDISTMSLETARHRAEATLSSATAQAADAHAKAERTRQLFNSKPTPLASQEELDTQLTTATQADSAVENAKAAMAELDQQKIQIATKEQQIKQMQAVLAQDQSRLDTAQQNVKYCKVYAPEADIPADPPQWFISSLLTNIAPGYIVQSGTSGFSAGTTIMTLSDLSHVYVLASVDESNIGLVTDPARGGERQKVKVTADAFPGRKFDGEVVRVATKGVNVSNVVTFEVKIEITGDSRRLLRPEMTTTCDIVCASKVDVLALPAVDFQRGGGKSAATASAPADLAAGTASAPADVVAATNPDDATTEPATTVASGTKPGGGRGNGGGRGRTGRGGSGGGSMNGPQSGVVTILNAKGASEQKPVIVGLLGTDPDDPGSGDMYEVISGLNDGDTVVRQSGQDLRFRGQNASQAIQRLGGGGGGRGR